MPVFRTRLPLLALPFAVALAALVFLSSIRANDRAFVSFLAASAALSIWSVALDFLARRRSLTLRFVPKRQHYLQACAQASVFIYWGLYWPPVRDFAPFLLAQLLFAYAFDMLLSWTRRDDYALGFAPFPVIFSINLFLWFKPDWFFLQFAMVALGLIAKETIRWTPDERRAHIFNPSSFPLAVFSLVLLATGATGITSGQEIATTQFFPPHIYLALFLIGLPGQFFFGVTSMTMSAVVTTWLFGRLYFAATGVYFFYDSYIPIAVFLGMHLLFTDPSTSPRSELGRIAYGAIYGLSTIAFYELLGKAGLPTFYDKLLPVPLMNLSVKAIDRVFGSIKLAESLHGYRRNLAYMAVWALVFTGLSATEALGDDHPGQYIPFWQHACDEGRRYACPYLADIELTACNHGSGWGCNEAGRMDITLSRSGEDLRRTSAAQALEPFNRGCDLKFRPACQNLYTLTHGGALVSAPPTLGDYRILLQGSKNAVSARPSESLFAVACKQGWPDTCVR